MENTFAIVEVGGKQYKVWPGMSIAVDRLPVAVGQPVELDKVLLVSQGEQVAVGTPTVPGAKVVAVATGHGRTRKIIVFKYKPKVRYRRKLGHRQHYTRLSIKEIVVA